MTADKPDDVLENDDHAGELTTLTATVVARECPDPHLMRLTIDIGDAATDPTWEQPNVAVRVNLGPRFDDASRVYTVRDADRSRSLITLDVVRHRSSSPMMRWSAAVRAGDQVTIVGPRPHFVVPEGRADAVLFADDSAIPALYEILRQWPSHRRADAFVLSHSDFAFDELPRSAQIAVHRVTVADGGLEAAARTIEHPAEVVVWAAGEREDMRTIRRYFRNSVGLGKDDVAVFGYWKKGVSNTDIDRVRLAAYQQLLARGEGLAQLDDLALDI
ncbi:siderophore-interacting protein [Gordonia sp. VNQ95]|jgi:NADPH-dependent ferric siderophore reductase|uniref:siderophore-interacting protein n=1 Tax=Gordonia TaxID=2053 RepID=UPI0032B3A670